VGLHPTALPEQTLREEDVDFVCQGEGPATLRGLLDVLRAGRDDYAGVPGLWHRRGDQVAHYPPAPLIQNLDEELGGVAWDLLPMQKYRAHNWHCFDHIHQRSPYAVIYSSLGCPYGCHFCCINALFGKRGIRYRGIPNVVAEIDLLVQQYGVKNIKILDELFVLKRDRVEEFCDLLIPRGYDLNFWAYARVDTVDRELLFRLRKAGVRWLAYGFESASNKVRDGVSKGFSEEQMERAIRWTQEAGIYIIANYMVGLPDDTEETMAQTLAEAKRYNFEFLNLYCTMAYPGSKLYGQAKAEGWKLPETWDAYSQLGYATQPLPTKHLTAAQVLSFRDRAFVDFFADPAYLEMIRSKFGRDVADHLQTMTEVKLKRKLLGD
jgi:anaerobic magnesium-protoporphyrin IX monomethyl ester cyclase